MASTKTAGDVQSDVLGDPDAILVLAITNAEQALHWLRDRHPLPTEEELRAKLLTWAEGGQS